MSSSETGWGSPLHGVSILAFIICGICLILNMWFTFVGAKALWRYLHATPSLAQVPGGGTGVSTLKAKLPKTAQHTTTGSAKVDAAVNANLARSGKLQAIHRADLPPAIARTLQTTFNGAARTTFRTGPLHRVALALRVFWFLTSAFALAGGFTNALSQLTHVPQSTDDHGNLLDGIPPMSADPNGFFCQVSMKLGVLSYGLGKCCSFLFFVAKLRAVRPLAGWTNMEKILVNASCGIAPFAIAAAIFTTGDQSSLDGTCQIFVPHSMIAGELISDFLLSSAFLVLFIKPLAATLEATAIFRAPVVLRRPSTNAAGRGGGTAGSASNSVIRKSPMPKLTHVLTVADPTDLNTPPPIGFHSQDSQGSQPPSPRPGDGETPSMHHMLFPSPSGTRDFDRVSPLRTEFPQQVQALMDLVTSPVSNTASYLPPPPPSPPPIPGPQPSDAKVLPLQPQQPIPLSLPQQPPVKHRSPAVSQIRVGAMDPTTDESSADETSRPPSPSPLNAAAATTATGNTECTGNLRPGRFFAGGKTHSSEPSTPARVSPHLVTNVMTNIADLIFSPTTPTNKDVNGGSVPLYSPRDAALIALMRKNIRTYLVCVSVTVPGLLLLLLGHVYDIPSIRKLSSALGFVDITCTGAALMYLMRRGKARTSDQSSAAVSRVSGATGTGLSVLHSPGGGMGDRPIGGSGGTNATIGTVGGGNPVAQLASARTRRTPSKDRFATALRSLPGRHLRNQPSASDFGLMTGIFSNGITLPEEYGHPPSPHALLRLQVPSHQEVGSPGTDSARSITPIPNTNQSAHTATITPDRPLRGILAIKHIRQRSSAPDGFVPSPRASRQPSPFIAPAGTEGKLFAHMLHSASTNHTPSNQAAPATGNWLDTATSPSLPTILASPPTHARTIPVVSVGDASAVPTTRFPSLETLGRDATMSMCVEDVEDSALPSITDDGAGESNRSSTGLTNMVPSTLPSATPSPAPVPTPVPAPAPTSAFTKMGSMRTSHTIIVKNARASSSSMSDSLPMISLEQAVPPITSPAILITDVTP